ncbi:SRPBCC family protein [Leifsonia sp. NPDC058248]|uniref:SRPBCC family protein n=1 Tax=Leifsonia sp. NPDC058248 TaxID=3346402 RepID=UPI0036D8752F
MVRITHTIDIDAPTQEVYTAIRALDGYPTWLGHSIVYRGTRVRSASAGAALAYEDSTMIGRMRGELLEEVPGQALLFHQAKPSGSLDARIRYEVEVAGAVVRVTRVGELTTHGMLRIVQPILVRMASRESERTMKALKTHVELTD